MAHIKVTRCRLTLLALIGFCALGCVIGEGAMAGVFTATYESNLTTTACLTSRERLSALLADGASSKLNPETYAELARATRRYLVVQISNTGNQRAWGSVKCSFAGKDIVVNVPDLSPHMTSPNLYVAEISGFILPASNSAPSIAVSWEVLNTK
ncbi:MAG: hypothetical protein ACOYCD_06240 [Kiritimatiellia bacterium]|jgi:hypothetical protein